MDFHNGPPFAMGLVTPADHGEHVTVSILYPHLEFGEWSPWQEDRTIQALLKFHDTIGIVVNSDILIWY